MQSRSTGTISGCVIWFIVFGLVNTCLIPLAMTVGGITSVTDLAIRTTGALICPDGSTADAYSYATTTTDEYGNSQPSTAYVLQCIDSNGKVVKEDPVLYSFIWIGILSMIGLLLAGLLAFAFATPAGLLIARLINKNKSINNAVNIEPK